MKELKDYPHIIFTTAYEQYALDAFKFNSIDYLLKPIDREELARIALLDRRSDRFENDAVTMLEDFTLRLILLDRLGEQDERHQGVALIVRSFGIVAVR